MAGNLVHLPVLLLNAIIVCSAYPPYPLILTALTITHLQPSMAGHLVHLPVPLLDVFAQPLVQLAVQAGRSQRQPGRQLGLTLCGDSTFVAWMRWMQTHEVARHADA